MALSSSRKVSTWSDLVAALKIGRTPLSLFLLHHRPSRGVTWVSSPRRQSLYHPLPLPAIAPSAQAWPQPAILLPLPRHRARSSTTRLKTSTTRLGGVPCIVRRAQPVARTLPRSCERRRNAVLEGLAGVRTGRTTRTRRRKIVCIAEYIAFHSLIMSPVQSPALTSPPQVTPIPKGKMRSSQN